MAHWITPQDVLDRWIGGGAPSLNSPQLTTIISDVEDAAAEAVPELGKSITEERLPLQRVKRILSGIVIRHYKRGYEVRASFSETTGPFSHSASFASDRTPGISLSDEEIASLTVDHSENARAFSVDMAPGAFIPNTSYYSDRNPYPWESYSGGWLR